MLKKISARHFDLTEEMKQKAEDEMDSLTKFFENIISAEMILDSERHHRIAELNVKVYNTTLTGTGDSDKMSSSIEIAVDKVIGQIKKYKGKLKDKKQDEIAEVKDALTRPITDTEGIE